MLLHDSALGQVVPRDFAYRAEFQARRTEDAFRLGAALSDKVRNRNGRGSRTHRDAHRTASFYLRICFEALLDDLPFRDSITWGLTPGTKP
jgi:hypothetical protein